MSALASPLAVPARPARSAAPRAVTPVVVTRAQRRARPRVVYAGVAVSGLFVILLAQLLLSIVLSDGAYRISALQTQTVVLDQNAQVLVESLDTLRSPQYLAANAESLGMVANASPAYLRLADSTVLGSPIAAGAGAGVLDGRDTMIGNVLLADVGLVTPVPEGEAPGVAPASTAPGSLASPPVGPAPSGALPSPVSR